MTLPPFEDTESMRIALSQAGTIPNAVLYNNGKALWDAISNSVGGNEYYGSFYDTTDQPLVSTTASQIVNINSTSIANNVTLSGAGRIIISAPGVYNLTYVVQVSNLSNAVENAAFWIRYNGVDYPHSTVEMSLLPRKTSTVPSTQLATVSITGKSIATGDYVELWWSGTSTLLSLQYDAAHTSPVVYPATPSIIANVIPISNISTGAPGPGGPGTPIGPAGGVLNGSYPNPVFAAGATLPPSGPAGGMLSGTYPNPNVASISGLAAGGVLSGTYPNPSFATAPVPAGALMPYAGASAPTGWLLCDGSAVSRTTYATLFSAIGTTYGIGDGATTFNVPDMRGRTAYGRGTNADVSALNSNDGLAVGSRTPKHSHTVNAHSHTVNSHAHGPGGYNARWVAGSGIYYTQTGGAGTWGNNIYGGLQTINAYAGVLGGGIIVQGTSDASAPGTTDASPGTSSVGGGYITLNYIIKG